MNKELVALSLAFFSSSHAFNLISFDGKPTKWGNSRINYIVDSRGSPDFSNGCDSDGPCETERTAIQKAFASWANVPGVNLTFGENRPQAISSTGYDGQNSITFVSENWGGLSFRPPAGALAVTITTYRLSDSQIVDADMHFNNQYFTWGVVNTASEQKSSRVVDIQNVAAHEIGHFLGLGHSSENYAESDMSLYLATMFFASGPGETFRRTLRADDIAAIQHLYPSSYVVTPVVDSIYPDEIDARTTGSATITIDGNYFLDKTTVLVARKSSKGDVVAKIINRTEHSLEVELSTYGLGTGDYDIIVANSPSAQDRIDKALAVTSYYTDDEDTGEYGNLNSGNGGGCVANPNSPQSLAQFILMFGLPFILFFPGRLQGVILRVRTQRNNYKKYN
ncbi:MAG: matrixin family metalloprotease [Bdellovibrionales bacterium]|nr:matrixin family metalloprotease [Bdellovibrionales bacterium]